MQSKQKAPNRNTELVIKMNEQKLTQAVEMICAMGCSSVNAIIVTLEAGKNIEGLEQFSDAEIMSLTEELKAIMAVYESRE
jgi:hypothetical protein